MIDRVLFAMTLVFALAVFGFLFCFARIIQLWL